MSLKVPTSITTRNRILLELFQDVKWTPKKTSTMDRVLLLPLPLRMKSIADRIRNFKAGVLKQQTCMHVLKAARHSTKAARPPLAPRPVFDSSVQILNKHVLFLRKSVIYYNEASRYLQSI